MQRKPGRLCAVVLLSLSLLTTCSQKSKHAIDTEGHQWWQHAVFYEIYPRSFADSNNDGVGDLKGITSKLDYLKDSAWTRSGSRPASLLRKWTSATTYRTTKISIRCTGRWRTSIVLASEAKKHGIHIILDFVVNHTSDQHKWFLDSKSSTHGNRIATGTSGATARDQDQPPNNWNSTSVARRGKFDPTTNQYYYHYFYPQQPDLNWRNPEVKDAMFDVDALLVQARRGRASGSMQWTRSSKIPTSRQPLVRRHQSPMAIQRREDLQRPSCRKCTTLLRGLRKVTDEYNAVLIGETWTANIAELNEYYGERNNELQMPMDLLFTRSTSFRLRSIPQAHRGQSILLRRMAGVRHQQSRHRALLRSLRRREAQRSDRKVDGGAVPDTARHADHVLRRRDWHEEQRRRRERKT